MIKTKAIAYAFALSKTAKKLNSYTAGCWFVEVREAMYYADLKPSVARNCEGYNTPNHPDLISFYNKTDGEASLDFLAYGNEKALAALGLIRKTNV